MIPELEKAISPFTVKPHFGKLFQMSGENFEKLYGKHLKVLRVLMAKYDPKGKFNN